jgi:hypothetical protein
VTHLLEVIRTVARDAFQDRGDIEKRQPLELRGQRQDTAIAVDVETLRPTLAAASPRVLRERVLVHDAY